MGCGASSGTLPRGKYQIGPLETPTGDKVLQMLKGQGRRSKPLLAPLDVDTEAKGAKDDKLAAGSKPKLLELPAGKERPARPSKETKLPAKYVPVSVNLFKQDPVQRKVLPPASPFRPLATHPTLHTGVEALVERQQTASRDLQEDLRAADRKVRTNHNELRALWREIHDSRTRACAAEAEIVRVLAQLVSPGAQEEKFNATRQTLAKLETELQVETEKGKRWLELARGLQGKFDGLMLEGLVDLPVTPAGIIFSAHTLPRGMHDDASSAATPRLARAA